MLGLRRNDLIFGVGMSIALLTVVGDIAIYRWGRRTLFDGQVISVVQIPLVDHPLFLQWLGIEVPVVTLLALVAFASLVILPAIWQSRWVTAIPAGFLLGGVCIGLIGGVRYHHDLLLSLDLQPVGVVRWSAVLVPSVLALLLLLVFDAQSLWGFRQRNGPLPSAIETLYLMRAGHRQERKERMDQAEKSFRRAYARVRGRLGENDPRTLGPLIELAWFTYDHPRDDGSEAGQLFRRGWEIAEKDRDIDRATLSQLFDGLGSTALREGNSQGAHRLYAQAVRAAEDADGAMSWRVALPLRHLAWATMLESKQEEAAGLAERSLAIARRNYGRRSGALVSFIETLARIREEQGRSDDAVRLREEVLQLAGDKGGPNTARALALMELARMRARQGKYVEADSLYEEALAMASDDRAERRRVVAEAFEGLAALRRAEGRLGDAEQYARQALAEREASWGRDSLAVVGPLVRLGDIYTGQGRPEEARSSLNRAIEIIESRSGPTDASLALPLEVRGVLERTEGNYELAETLVRRGIALTEAHYGTEDRHLVPLLVLLGTIASEQGRPTETRQILERGLTLSERAYGRNHPETARVLAQLAYEADVTDDIVESERWHRDEIDALQRSPDASDAKVADAFERFADFLERRDRADEAVEAKRQSMELMVKHARQNRVDTP